MPFEKYANAAVVDPSVNKAAWNNIRTAAVGSLGSIDLISQASDIFAVPFKPADYLLTHATIVASVDVIDTPNAKLGSVMEHGFKVHRKFSDFRLAPDSQKFVNNNNDCWSRGVLQASYGTFIGAHNFCEHVQIEELSKGRIIDAVARDIGPSLYADILIATERKHTELIRQIQSGEMSTLSMGCFTPGTMVTMADGRRIPIEDIAPGDMVLTHKGRAREVINKQIRYGQWSLRRIHAVGVPNTIEATDNHPFFVVRPSAICACGCGGGLPEYKGERKNTARGFKRRFLRGHDKRILNPNNTYSLEEYKKRKAQMEAIKSPGEGQWVRADELRIGDLLCFPRVQTEGAATGISTGKARLLGYFLAEGSFQKYQGELSAVEFSFSTDEEDTFVAEVVDLLQQEFPGKDPTVNSYPHRKCCSVRLGNRHAAHWFFQHGGEYSSKKRISSEAMAWPVEAHKHLIGTWINGDGHLHGIHGHTSGTTTSYDLVCQMHLLMARCGWFARMEAKIGARCVEVREIANGGFVRDAATGKLPHFNLIVGKMQATEMAPYTTKVVTTAFESRVPRVRDDMVMFPITSIEEAPYEGWVHNMEVAEDNSYVVSGICTHNCTVDFTICTKCGHVAADETEMCFPAGTRVLTVDGKYIPIEEIVEGDLVVTHKGAIQPVLHTMGRHHDGNITVLTVEGEPQPVRATTGHRFWVMRPETVCQCGCGEPLRRTIEHERGSVKAFQRRFLPGHNSKVTSITPDREVKLEFVPAKDIRKGDYLTFPIPQQVKDSPEATTNKARLIGFFLAEGSFIKRDGGRVGVSFDFGAHEYDTLATEVEGLLNDVWGRDERRTSDTNWQDKVAAEGLKPIRRRKTSRLVPADLTCPSCEAPAEYAYNVRFKKGRNDCYRCKVCNRHWIGEADRAIQARRYLTGASACAVRLMWADAAEWFHHHCGEYSHGKVLPQEVMFWSPDVQKHILFSWLGGDGTQSRLGITGNTASFDLMSQMHVLAARCGWYSRKQVTFDRRAVILDEVVNGAGPVTVRDSNGWLPSFSLTVADPVGFGGEVRFSDPEKARVTLSGITDGFKRVGNYLLYRVRETWNECFSGQVFNIEVAGDESFVVEGLAVHNCPHIKFQKGSTYIDHKTGQILKIAELCFPPGFRVSMADGSRQALGDIQVGDLVQTHRGRVKPVTKVFRRDFVGEMVTLDVTGVPQTIQSTPNHPFLVLPHHNVCSCGCGTTLKIRPGFGRSEYLRKWARGHHPAGEKVVFSLERPTFEFKEARAVRVGDMLAVPISQEVREPVGISETKARLLGWFLAEGSFIKKDGERNGIQLTLNATDERPVADQLAQWLAEEFPPEPRKDATRADATYQPRSTPWTQRVLDYLAEKGPCLARHIRADLGLSQKQVESVLTKYRKISLVRSWRPSEAERQVLGLGEVSIGQAKLWKVVGDPVCARRRFGQAAHKSRVEALRNAYVKSYPRVYQYERINEAGEKLVVCYTNRQAADWFYAFAGEYAAHKQLSAEVLTWPRRLQEPLLRAYVRGDGGCDSLDRYDVCSISETLISQMQVIAARCGLWTRRLVIYEGRSVELQAVANGAVISVGEDGFRPRHELHFQPSDQATELLSWDGPRHIRRQAPAWRQYEGYMLQRVRSVGRTRYDGPVCNIEVDDDHSYLVEGLAVHNCGHETVDPSGGVVFIEASWVRTPAFAGAVTRNILEPTEELSRQIEAVLASPPREWSDDAQKKVAADVTKLSQWDEEGEEKAEGEGEEKAEGEAETESPLKGVQDEVEKYILDQTLKSLKKKVKEDALKDELGVQPSSAAPNDSVNKWSRKTASRNYVAAVKAIAMAASSEPALMNAIAAFNQSVGIRIPVHVYRGALQVGARSKYASDLVFRKACRQVLGRVPYPAELQEMLALSTLLTRRHPSATTLDGGHNEHA